MIYWNAYVVVRLKAGDNIFVNVYHRGSSWGTRMSHVSGYVKNGTQVNAINHDGPLDNGCTAHMWVYFIKE
jgi:hypothetical protein